MVKFYGYTKCSTCQKAKKFLKDKDVSFDEIDIVSVPPTKSEIKSILKLGEYSIKELFNRSGQLYREFNMKDKIDQLSIDELVDMLAKHGKLVKRPLIILKESAVVGFKEDRLSELIKKGF